ncbi:Cytochrome P450 [Penicillium soppii]|uniref:Cytochrome P450 n=1 Tax=Penicillium soppii TaxID=69789 RepID=UPI0025472877|nr:Cytochrome P450 [Penicillium soppii]KAJ5864171.1 Cytochrome P450 [Penicillium soppii]
MSLSFSRRYWVQLDAELHKSNGRIKHEFHEVKSGPFQAIVVDSCQANDENVRSKSSPSTN